METRLDSYNSWSNYQTWNVALWIDNEYTDYVYWNDRAEQVEDDEELAKELERSFRDELGGPWYIAAAYWAEQERKRLWHIANSADQVKRGVWTGRQFVVFSLEGGLKDFYMELKPKLNGALGDILTFELAWVDWRKLAEGIVEGAGGLSWPNYDDLLKQGLGDVDWLEVARHFREE